MIFLKWHWSFQVFINLKKVYNLWNKRNYQVYISSKMIGSSFHRLITIFDFLQHSVYIRKQTGWFLIFKNLYRTYSVSYSLCTVFFVVANYIGGETFVVFCVLRSRLGVCRSFISARWVGNPSGQVRQSSPEVVWCEVTWLTCVTSSYDVPRPISGPGSPTPTDLLSPLACVRVLQSTARQCAFLSCVLLLLCFLD